MQECYFLRVWFQALTKNDPTIVVAALVASFQKAFQTNIPMSIGQLTTCAGIDPAVADATKTTTAVLLYLAQFPW